MRRFLLGLTAGFILAPLMIRAQQGINNNQGPTRLDFLPQGDVLAVVPALPPIDLSLSDVIDVLASYSLIHGAKVPGYLGQTDHANRTIHVYDWGGHYDKRDTVIHELFHVKCYSMSRRCEEPEIEQGTALLYRRLFVENR